MIFLLLVSVLFSIPFVDLDSNREIKSEFLQKLNYAGSNEQALVFFGFERCHDVCPATMSVLHDLKRMQTVSKKSPHIVFIDIDRNSNQESAMEYAMQFHQSFIGHFPTEAELENLKMEFGLNIKQAGETVSHIGRVYLLERNDTKWWIKKSYSPSRLSVDKLFSDINVGDNDHV